MARHQVGDKPVPDLWCHMVPVGHNESKNTTVSCWFISHNVFKKHICILDANIPVSSENYISQHYHIHLKLPHTHLHTYILSQYVESHSAYKLFKMEIQAVMTLLWDTPGMYQPAWPSLRVADALVPNRHQGISNHQRIFNQHCGYWWPGALAPGHQYPQCWLHTHALPVVYRLSQV